MKKYWIVGLTLLVILVGAVTFALAQGETAQTTTPIVTNAIEQANPGSNITQDTAPVGNGFIDEDGDGTCDNCGATTPAGTMSGNQYGAANQGDNFIDEDGDGICDTCGEPAPLAAQDGTGNRYGANGAQGNGHTNTNNGGNFIDEDGDGICDTCGTASGTGSNFVDEDGDGVCDTCGTSAQQQLGQGNRFGQTGSRGNGNGGHGGGNSQP